MNVAFRADASTDIGSGHFMRCLSLADGLRVRGADVSFVSLALPAHLRHMLEERKYELASLDYPSHPAAPTTDADASLDALSGRRWDWLAVDHYALDARWEEAMRDVARRILVIDDLADRPHACDVLLDQNLSADMDTRYAGKVPATCRQLLGPRYALMREDFRQLRGRVTPRTGSVQRILIFFGGGDARNVTGLAIRALANCGLKGVHVDVVIGTQHAHREDIEVTCREQGFSCHVETTRMAELLSVADLAIGAGGTATWERCCMGVPALAFSVAGNQQRVVEGAALQGLLYAPTAAAITVSSIERHVNALLDNPHLLQMMSRKAFDAVDGLGVKRVVRALDGDSILIREATMEDAEALFAWRNDESVRSVSRDPRRIEWPDHRAWLAGVMADRRQLLVIGECAGVPVGVVRFEVTGDEAEVSIYMVPGSAGSGLGSRLLLAAESWLLARRRDIAAIKAETLEHNRPSHKLFQSTGYVAQSTLYIKRMSA